MKISDQIRQAGLSDFEPVGILIPRGPGEAQARLAMIKKITGPAQTLAELNSVGKRLEDDSKEIAAVAEGSCTNDPVRVSSTPLQTKGAFAVYGPLIILKVKGASRDKLAGILKTSISKYGYRVLS